MSRVANHIRVRHTTSMISGTNGPRCSHMIYSFVINAAMPAITIIPTSSIHFLVDSPNKVKSSDA